MEGQSEEETFSEQVLKVCVAKICTRLGYEYIQTEALDIIVQVIKRYIRRIGNHCRVTAELNHRGGSRSTAQDLFQTYEAQRSTPFRVGYKQLTRITQQKMWDVPFISTVPDYPLSTQKYNDLSISYSSFSEAAENSNLSNEDGAINKAELSRPNYVPDFMPRFPPLHTYQVTYSKAVEKEAEGAKESTLQAINIQESLALVDRQHADKADGSQHAKKL